MTAAAAAPATAGSRRHPFYVWGQQPRAAGQAQPARAPGRGGPAPGRLLVDCACECPHARRQQISQGRWQQPCVCAFGCVPGCRASVHVACACLSVGLRAQIRGRQWESHGNRRGVESGWHAAGAGSRRPPLPACLLQPCVCRWQQGWSLAVVHLCLPAWLLLPPRCACRWQQDWGTAWESCRTARCCPGVGTLRGSAAWGSLLWTMSSVPPPRSTAFLTTGGQGRRGPVGASSCGNHVACCGLCTEQVVPSCTLSAASRSLLNW